MFTALFGWNQMNTFLVQGGWPYLRQYPRAYARVVFTVMILIFAAVESYNIGDMNTMNVRVLALAGKLVGDPGKPFNYWKVRKSPYLRGPKLAIPLGPAHANVSPVTRSYKSLKVLSKTGSCRSKWWK